MPNAVFQSLKLIFTSLAIVASLLFNQNAALIASVLILAVHGPRLKPQEWRILIQVTVLGWAVNAIFLRMQLVEIHGDYFLFNRIICWTLLASTLCHSLYAVIKHFAGALLVGAFWGVVYFIVPVLSGQFITTLSWPVLIISAAISGMLVLLIFSFIIRTRIFPQETTQ